jgi:hypothetical protein
MLYKNVNKNMKNRGFKTEWEDMFVFVEINQVKYSGRKITAIFVGHYK